jgi:hypothetical protein
MGSGIDLDQLRAINIAMGKNPARAGFLRSVNP